MEPEGEELTPSRMFNPCLPPNQTRAADLDPDRIEGTQYSKAWVLSVLANLMQEVEKHADLEGCENRVDVSESQQSELGQLWDMTRESEVNRFLMQPDLEYNTGEMLTCAVFKSRAPRINEICIGILGNICSEVDLCARLSQNDDFMKMIYTILNNNEFDPPTLKEAIRLVLTCLGHTEVRQQWLQAMTEIPELFSLIIFVLESSVDEELLNRTGIFLDTLMEKLDNLCEEWATLELVNSVLIAMKQIGHKEKEKVKPFLSILQLLSTSQPGVQCLVERNKDVMSRLLRWLGIVCDDDILVLTDYMPYITCVYSVLNILLTNAPLATEHLTSETSVIKDMLKTVGSLYNIYPVYDDPYALPTCIVFTPRLTSSAKEASEGSSAQPTDAVSDPQTAGGETDVTTDSTVTETANNESTVASGDDSDTKSEAHDDSKRQTVGESGQGEDREEERVSQFERERLLERERELEEREKEREITRYADCQHYKALLESLQEYFRNFFKHMVLEDLPEEEGEKKERRRMSTSVNFYRVMKHLDKCHRKSLGYIVSILVYNIPDSIDGNASAEDTGQDKTSAEGWKVVSHLRHLFKKLHLKYGVEMLDSVVHKVKKTAGISRG